MCDEQVLFFKCIMFLSVYCSEATWSYTCLSCNNELKTNMDELHDIELMVKQGAALIALESYEEPRVLELCTRVYYAIGLTTTQHQ